MNARKLIAFLIVGATLTGCSAAANAGAGAASTSAGPAAPTPSTWQITAEPASSQPTTAQPPASPTSAPANFTPVTVAGWRYGVAWTDFETDTGSLDDPTTPGWVNVDFTVSLRFADDRRPTEPPPSADWVGFNLGWAFYVSDPTIASATCPDTYPDEPCELSTGPVYEGCTRVDTSHTQTFGTVLTETCAADDDFREGVTARDFAVFYQWTDAQGATHQLRLPYNR